MRSDLEKHAAVGAAIGAVVAFAAVTLGLAQLNQKLVSLFFLGVALGTLASYAAGWVKEYWYDARHPDTHTVDPLDLRYTWMGGVLGSVAGAALAVFMFYGYVLGKGVV